MAMQTTKLELIVNSPRFERICCTSHIESFDMNEELDFIGRGLDDMKYEIIGKMKEMIPDISPVEKMIQIFKQEVNSNPKTRQQFEKIYDGLTKSDKELINYLYEKVNEKSLEMAQMEINDESGVGQIP